MNKKKRENNILGEKKKKCRKKNKLKIGKEMENKENNSNKNEEKKLFEIKNMLSETLKLQ